MPIAIVKHFIKSITDKLGVVIHRQPEVGLEQEPYRGPVEALYYHYIDRAYSCPAIPSITFDCPIHKIVSSNGFNHSKDGWHPFSAVLTEFDENRSLNFDESVLRQYYDSWAPASAGEAIAGWTNNNTVLADLPSYVILPPWNPNTIKEEREAVKSWTLKDNREHGKGDLGFEEGCNYHGPVSLKKGTLEFDRLVNTFESLEQIGYNRSRGPVCVNILKRGDEYRYIAVGGHHRIAAMRALNKPSIPATLRFNWIIDIDHSEAWPQVRRGIWKKENAESFFNHLFDFDSLTWAKEIVFSTPV